LKPVLRIPVFRRLLAAYTLNELAYWVGTVALTLLIYRRTGSALGATAFFLCAQFVPALLSPMLVARLDQLPLRPILPALYWLEAVIFLALAALAGRHFMLVTVLALTFLNGILALTARSLARAATVAVTSAVGLLREGNALGNAGFSLAFLIGPGLGGAVVAAGGTTQALLGDAALFAVVGVVLATATGLPQPSPVRSPARGRVRAAVDYVRERPPLRGLMLLQASGILFFTISVPVEVVFAQHTLHAGAAGYGGMVSAWGAGAVAGAAVYARWKRLPSRALIALGAGALGIGLLVMALAPTVAVAIVGAAVAGVGNGIESVAGRTAVQELTEASWMALMMSLQESLYQTVPGAGILLGGTITALGSPRTALAVAGAGSLVVTLLVWVMLTDLAPSAGPVEDAAGVSLGTDPAPPPGRDSEGTPGADLARSDSGLAEAHAPAVRHQ
jgi:Transmembrane secretion effector